MLLDTVTSLGSTIANVNTSAATMRIRKMEKRMNLFMSIKLENRLETATH
jgi:hypothetical protein